MKLSTDTVLASGFIMNVCLTAAAQTKERLVITNVDARTAVSFRLQDATVQTLLPEGWEVDTAPDGANLRVIFVDNLIVQDADGKTTDNLRSVLWAVPAKTKPGGDKAGMAIGGFVSSDEAAPGPYGNFYAASATLIRKASVDKSGKSTVEETWTFKTQSDDMVEFKIQFVRGPLARSKANIRTYSAQNPDLYRIYRVEQAVDMIDMSLGNNDRVQELVFKVKGSKLGPVFDGTERLVDVTSTPWYARQVYLPGN